MQSTNMHYTVYTFPTLLRQSSSPDLIRCVYRFQYTEKGSALGLVLSLGLRLMAHQCHCGIHYFSSSINYYMFCSMHHDYTVKEALLLLCTISLVFIMASDLTVRP